MQAPVDTPPDQLRPPTDRSLGNSLKQVRRFAACHVIPNSFAVFLGAVKTAYPVNSGSLAALSRSVALSSCSSGDQSRPRLRSSPAALSVSMSLGGYPSARAMVGAADPLDAVVQPRSISPNSPHRSSSPTAIAIPFTRPKPPPTPLVQPGRTSGNDPDIRKLTPPH